MSNRHHPPVLLVTGTAGTMTKTLEPCKTPSGIISAAKADFAYQSNDNA